jgi:hypothetical protein
MAFNFLKLYEKETIKALSENYFPILLKRISLLRRFS